MTGTLLALAGCSSIVSQETCEIGNWEAQGYTDGSNGKSPDRLSKIVEACSEYGLSVNNQAYYKGYEAGLPKYCTYERGYSRGESGRRASKKAGKYTGFMLSMKNWLIVTSIV